MADSRIMADEQETRLEESAVAEAEIEPDEGLEQEPEIKPDESAAAEGDGVGAGCPIGMGELGKLRCGRKLHLAPDGSDEEPVCLMHSKDPHKRSGLLFDTFWCEFERILADAGDKVAHFERFVFPMLNFKGRRFQAECLFIGATFTQYANFWGTTFSERADFSSATFTQGASFFDATFTWGARFFLATFTQDADFRLATFRQDADFSRAIFTQGVSFEGTRFHGTANWESSRFLDQVDFRHTQFDPRIAGRPSAVFALASFSKPERIVFEKVDLSRALFHNCDVSQVWFTSSVQWAKREGNRSVAVFDETVSHKMDLGDGDEIDLGRDNRAVAQIYQQLKKNYDSRLDYWTGNEFHFGEMEMKRLAVPGGGLFLRLRRWWQPRLSLIALYRYASDYGNSYGKPMLWLLGTLVFFAALLPLPGVGLKRQGARQVETYSSVWRTGDGWAQNLWAEARLAGKGAITSVDAATFQKSAEYAPAYPWGRVLAIFETLLTSTLFALFLLAIRRQFRR